ncbi:hypothetical protein QF032_007497 [Streptomyces achromogenes]|nr:hypothetical protein [Streptomyces achromogenes]
MGVRRLCSSCATRTAVGHVLTRRGPQPREEVGRWPASLRVHTGGWRDRAPPVTPGAARCHGRRPVPSGYSTLAQSSVRSTAFFQPAYPSARWSSDHWGSQRLDSCQWVRSSSVSRQNPVARPAA